MLPSDIGSRRVSRTTGRDRFQTARDQKPVTSDVFSRGFLGDERWACYLVAFDYGIIPPEAETNCTL